MGAGCTNSKSVNVDKTILKVDKTRAKKRGEL